MVDGTETVMAWACAESVTVPLADAEQPIIVSSVVALLEANTEDAVAPACIVSDIVHAGNQLDCDGSATTARPFLDLESGLTVTAAVTMERFQSDTRAQYLCATVLKKTPESKIGLGLREHQDGSLCISFIRESSSLSVSPLQIGDRLLSINGKSCAGMSKAAAVRLLTGAKGLVTLVAHGPEGDPNCVETMVEKPTKDHPVGLGLRRNSRGSLEVNKVTVDGLFSHCLINIGDSVLAINQTDCRRLEPQAAIDRIKSSLQYVTLLSCTTGIVLTACDDSEAIPAMATADLVAVSNSYVYGLPKNLCYCSWMILLSLLVVSSIILGLGRRG